MRQIINNLSVRNKILVGFFLVVAMFACYGFYQYNKLIRINIQQQTLEFAGRMSTISSQIKFYLTKDILNLKDYSIAKTEKELKSARKEHIEVQRRMEELFNSVSEIPEGNINDERIRKNFRDTINIIRQKYLGDFTISYNEIYMAQLKVINPDDIENTVSQQYFDARQQSANMQGGRYVIFQEDKIDSIAGVKHNLPTSQLDVLVKNYLTELKNEQKKHNQIILRLGNEIEKILSITETKASSLQKRCVASSLDNQSNLISGSVIFFLVAIAFAILVSYYVSSLITNPLQKIRIFANRLSKGELPEFEDDVFNDEIGETANSMVQLTEGLQQTSDFANKIGKGEFESKYQPLSDKDVLGNSLLNMRKSLQKAQKETVRRQKEDEQRNWATEGLAKFADILRHHQDNITALADEIIVSLVSYLNANQGGIFYYNDTDDEDVYLELLSSYAYNRKKFIKRKIRIGEGLVGAVAQEKYTLYVKDIPDDYIEIESGIGSANPKVLLIVPLKIDQTVMGVIEMASFNEFRQHEIDLVEKIAESIASTLYTARNNTKNSLLMEEQKVKQQAMREQEDMMRQTIEEQQAAQENYIMREQQFERELKEAQAEKKILEQQSIFMDSEFEALRKKYEVANKLVTERENYENNLFGIVTAAVIVASEDGTITYINDLFTTLLGFKSAETLGKSVYKILGFTSKETEMNQALISEFGTIINTQGRSIKVKNRQDKDINFWLTVTSNVLNEKVFYTFMLDDLSNLTAEKDRSRHFEEEMLTDKFEFERKNQLYESLLKQHNIELPGLESEYFMFNQEDGYKIGLSILDSQHRKLFDVINRFYAAFKRKESLQKMTILFDELIDYSSYHFGFKEKYLNDFNQVLAQEHKEYHEKFVETLRESRKQYFEGSSISLIKMIIFIKDWVENYFKLMDENYVKMFKDHGLS